MIRIFIIVFVYFVMGTSRNPDCIDVKVGTFKVVSDNITYIITRSKDRQIERDNKLGQVTEFKIHWKSDCEYILFDRKLLQGPENVHQNFHLDTLHCRIIKFEGNSHIVENSMKGLPNYQFTLEKI